MPFSSRPSTTPRGFALVAWACLLGALASAPLHAEAWDPFPRLGSDERVAVKDRIDGATYDPLRRCLADRGSAVGADYWAAVVEVTSPRGVRTPDDGDAVPYAEALAERWSGRLGDASVLMVVSTLNRGVALHVGERWADLAFDGAVVSRTIDRSRFGSLAARGDTGLALCALADAVDDELAALAPSRDGDPFAGLGPSASAVDDEPFSPDRDILADDARSAASDDWLGCAGCGMPLILLLLAAAGLAVWARGRRAKARAAAVAEVERWSALLATAAERLLVLERRHPLYFATGELRWSGESEALDRDTAEAVNRLYLLYGAAWSLHDRADRAVETARGWSTKGFDEALAILRDETVHIDAEAPLADGTGNARTIPLPLREGIDLPSAAVPGALEDAFADAAEHLARAEEAEDTRREAADRAATAAAGALDAMTERDALELPSGHLTAVYEPLEARRAEAATRHPDPVAAAAALAAVADELEALARRARGGNETIARLRDVVAPRLDAVEERLAARRAEGHPLREPGFEPDLRLERGERQADAVVDALEAGREDEARATLEALAADLEQLDEQIEAAVEARDTVPRALERLATEVEQLRERTPRARATLEALRRDHHPESFTQEADNLDELAELLPQLDTWRAHIAEDHEAVRPLSALEDLATLEALLADSDRLLDEIHDAESTLDASRQRARDGLDEARDAEGRALELRDAEGVGTETRDALGAAAERLEALRLELGATADGAPPHWPRLESEIAATRARLDEALRTAAADREAHDDARRRFEGVARRLADLERRERAEVRDRPHVESAVRDAAARAETLRASLAAGTESGRSLLDAVESLTQAVDWAESAFRREVDTIRVAETELEAAGGSVTRADGRSLGFGVVTDASEARRLLREAEQARADRRWDDVASLARRAREAAEEEERLRRAEARRLESEQRRRMLAAQAAEMAARMAASRARAGSLPRVPLAPAASRPSWRGGGGAASSFGRARPPRPRPSRPRPSRPRPSRRGGSGGSTFGGGSGRGGGSGGSTW